jgi:hypothetical protein
MRVEKECKLVWFRNCTTTTKHHHPKSEKDNTKNCSNTEKGKHIKTISGSVHMYRKT